VSTEAIGTIIEEMAPLRLSKATRSPRRAGRAPTDPPSEPLRRRAERRRPLCPDRSLRVAHPTIK